jgi:L,D-transpeptidase ErfK/SrfK
MKRPWRLFSALCFAASAAAPAVLASEPVLVGSQFQYTVRRGDTLVGIGARYGIDAATLAARNGLPSKARPAAGRILRIDNRHIVPRVLDDGILINIPQRLLFYFENGRLAGWWPVGLGQRGGWGTPTGTYKVVGREKNPVWKVPASIREEMRSKGERVQRVVPPGPGNPLGNHRLRLSLECCGIHGTNDPRSIYRFDTHGCIRLAPANAKVLFARARTGLPVEIIYEAVLIARDGDGATFLEVHPDIYGNSKDQTDAADAIAYGRGLLAAWESPLFRTTVRAEQGIAVPLTPGLALSDPRPQPGEAARTTTHGR